MDGIHAGNRILQINRRGKSFATSFTVLGSERNITIVNSTTAILVYSWDPSIAVSNEGTVYVAFMHGRAIINITSGTAVGEPVGAPFVAVSHDHGVSFSGISQVRIPAQTEFNDRDWIAVSPTGTVYVTWDHVPNLSSLIPKCMTFGTSTSCGFGAGDFNGVILDRPMEERLGAPCTRSILTTQMAVVLPLL